MPAAVIGGVIAGAGAIGAASISSSAAKKASKTAAAAQEKATDSSLQIAQIQEKLFRDIHKESVEAHQPYLESGYGAQSVVMQLLGLKPLSAKDFNSGQWYEPGRVDYTPPPAPAQPAPAQPAPMTPAPATPAPASLEEQATAAIRGGADPLAVKARLIGIGQHTSK